MINGSCKFNSGCHGEILTTFQDVPWLINIFLPFPCRPTDFRNVVLVNRKQLKGVTWELGFAFFFFFFFFHWEKDISVAGTWVTGTGNHRWKTMISGNGTGTWAKRRL